jgi:hypothetical protein
LPLIQVICFSHAVIGLPIAVLLKFEV